MLNLYIFIYEVNNGNIRKPDVNDDSVFKPPNDLPKWKYEDGEKVFVIIAYNGGEKIIRNIKIDIAFAGIIRGWKIYHLEKVRVAEGGMLNDRMVKFFISDLKPHEIQRIDVLIRGHSLKRIKGEYGEGNANIFVYA